MDRMQHYRTAKVYFGLVQQECTLVAGASRCVKTESCNEHYSGDILSLIVQFVCENIAVSL